LNSPKTLSDTWVPFIVVSLLLSTALVQTVVGFNTVLFPVRLEDYGYSKSLIGIILSFEIASVLFIVSSINRIISSLGLVGGRVLMLFILSQTRSFPLWCLSIFVFGLSTYLILIALQTWINGVPLQRYRGLVIGCFSSALSLGTASGPIVLNIVGVDGQARPFYVVIGIALLCLLIILPFLRFAPFITSQPRLRLLYSIRNAKIPMMSSLVGGVTFFGLPAFITLYGIMNGLSVQNSALLLVSFMIGSVFIGPLISALSDSVNKVTLTVSCVLVGVVCAVYLPLGIYDFKVAALLMFVWGAAAGGIYATGLSSVGILFRNEDQVSANVAYSVMDNVGGVVGVLLIGFLMGAGVTDGIVFVTVFTALSFFIFCLSQLGIE
jgi:predicted MFS family arabinose efflux permease